MSASYINDSIQSHDKIFGGGLRGEILIGRGKYQVPFIDPYGKQSYRTEFRELLDKMHNIVPIGGYQFVFDKLFNIGLDQETTLRVGDLNDEPPQMNIGVTREAYISNYYNAETYVPIEGINTTGKDITPNAGVNISAMNFVFGFMMGDGGSREDNMTAIAPDYKDRALFRAVPFRMSNDGYSFPEGRYYGKYISTNGVNNSSTISYYVKKFDKPNPRIVHSWVTDDSDEFSIVDDTVFSSTSSMAIESYVEINMSVDEYDGRGFFTSTGSSSRINEFALVSGWYNPLLNDYESLRVLTHYTRPSITLSEGDSIEIIYRLYAR